MSITTFPIIRKNKVSSKGYRIGQSYPRTISVNLYPFPKRITSIVTATISPEQGIPGVTKDLEGTISSSSVLAGDLSCIKSFDGEVLAASSLSGELTVEGKVSLSGAISAISSLSGELAVEGAISLESTIPSTSSINGTLNLEKLLSGDLSSTSTVEGDLSIKGSVSLSGVISVISIGSGVVDINRLLETSISSSSTVVGSINNFVGVKSSLQSTSTLTATLDVVIQNIVPISGNISSNTILSGSINRSRLINGNINILSALSGNIQNSVGCQGDIAAESSLVGALDVVELNVVDLAGLITTMSSASSTLSVKRGISAVVEANSTLTGVLTKSFELSVDNITSVSTLSGDFVRSRNFGGSISSVSSLSNPVLYKSIGLSSTITDNTTLDGVLYISKRLNGSIIAMGSLTSILSVSGEFVGATVIVDAGSRNRTWVLPGVTKNITAGSRNRTWSTSKRSKEQQS